MDPAYNGTHVDEKFKQLIESTTKDLHLVDHPGFSTLAIHAGQKPDPHYGSVTVPIHLATTFIQESPGQLKAGFDYARCGNPTRNSFEECIAAIEHGKFGLAFSSGCAAMTCILLLLKSGEHMIACDDVYGGTQRYIRNILEPRHGVEASWVDLTNKEAITSAIKENTKLLWIETPTNPTLKICDIRWLCDLARSKGIITVVDNTFCSPYLQSPLLLGADICVNSCTKYIGGHTDVVMGSITLNDKELRDRLYFNQKSFGGVPSPFDSYLALRGIKTLKLRIQESCRSAMVVARYLEKHPKVEKVIYPGLESHPQHELAKQQMRGFGGMITFYVKGGLAEAKKFLESVRLFFCAESLGGVDSLIESPAIMTHYSVPPHIRQELGISDTLIRISIGIEDVNDLLNDLDNAFNQI
eukprot:TRINITY_DN1016_c0_g1_i1.p1 TRINITY_DN1016_c0_g1~~TRINITY_DN1016_c0_g1_i1.p1  ORF type:complete len:413 (+),score=108.78 TRINITY_DN1016_c0_g1_i1:152-1390(+)